MKPSKITIDNFMSIEHAELDLASRGLTLILGEVRDGGQMDSNGAGKSTIFDALTWALWGETARGVKKADEVVRRQAGKDCQVSLDFEVDGVDYRVVRTRAHTSAKKANDLELFVGGAAAASHSNSETQEKINSIISLDFTTFCAMMPGTHIKAAEMTDKNIKVLLETLLQAESFEKAYTKAREKKRDAKSALDKCTAALEFKKNALEQTKERLNRFYREATNFDKARQAELDNIDVKIAEVYDEIEKLKAQSPGVLEKQVQAAVDAYTDLKKKQDEKLQEFSSQKSALNTRADTLREQIEKFDALGEDGHACNHCGTPYEAPKGLKEEIAEIDAQLKKLNAEIMRALPEMKKALSEKKGAAENMQAAWDRWAKAKVRIDQLEPQLALLDSQREQMANKQSPYVQLVKDTTEEFTVVNEQVQEAAEAVKSAKDDYEKFSFWAEGFSPAGIRSYVMQHIVPILNDRAEKYCKLLTDGQLRVEFAAKTQVGKVEKDQFSINASYKNGAESYESCSKGERARVNLVVSLCLGDLAALRTRKSVPFRFLDEPFENVDGTGVDSIMRLLRDYSKKYESVFLISHNDVLKSQISDVITVVKENGVSSINA